MLLAMVGIKMRVVHKMKTRLENQKGPGSMKLIKEIEEQEKIIRFCLDALHDWNPTLLPALGPIFSSKLADTLDSDLSPESDLLAQQCKFTKQKLFLLRIVLVEKNSCF